jgi:glutaredoxin 3
VAIEEYDITMGGPKRAEMLARAPGASTVPQIFIDDRHVGGSDDLAALDARGGLDELLAA